MVIFPCFPICFLYKKALKQKRKRLDVSPTFSSLKNRRISSSHSIHSYGKRASEVYLFALNRISRYLTELMGLTDIDLKYFGLWHTQYSCLNLRFRGRVQMVFVTLSRGRKGWILRCYSLLRITQKFWLL